MLAQPQRPVPVDENTALMAALRDDIAASTHPDERVWFTAEVICELLDEVIRLRVERTGHAVCRPVVAE